MFHTVGNRKVHSLSFGAGPATLVAIAGSFANWEIWAPTFERLSPNWRVVGFDHDGVGETRVPVEEISHERRIETLFSVLDAQGVERCVLAGDSNNTTVAVDAVLRQPERFAGLALVNGHVAGFDRPEVRRFVDGLRTHFTETLDFFVNIVFPEPDSDHLKRWLHDIISRTGPEAAAAISESYFELDLTARLGEVKVPTLVLHGALDVVSSTAGEDATHMAEALGAEFHRLEDAGHLPLLSRPDVIAAHLDTYLTRTLDGRT